MTKTFKAFRFDPTLYAKFKELAVSNNLMVTEAFEKFMRISVETGAITWPEPAAPKHQTRLEAEARVLLEWLKNNKFWYSDEGKEVSVPARLLKLLSQIQNDELKQEIEDQLKNSMKPSRDHTDLPNKVAEGV